MTRGYDIPRDAMPPYLDTKRTEAALAALATPALNCHQGITFMQALALPSMLWSDTAQEKSHIYLYLPISQWCQPIFVMPWLRGYAANENRKFRKNKFMETFFLGQYVS